jgi:2,3,4,5-tetrahydropyridine-2-carboxylate N-succinyltransferase
MTTSDSFDEAALRASVEAAYENRDLLSQDDETHRRAVRRTIALLDEGRLRVATPPAQGGGEWTVNAWVKQAILLYFGLQEMKTDRVGSFEYHD